MDTFHISGELPVRRLGFGAMRLPRGTFNGPTRDRGNGLKVLHRAVELGANHIDTAWFYRSGEVAANDLIREALSPYPADLVIATKVGPKLGPDGMPSLEAGPDELRGLVEDNLTSLGLDRLDLVYLRVGGLGPIGGYSIGERFEALAALREEGLIRHLGVSNIDSAQLAEARAVAPVAAVQNHFHLTNQGDKGLLAECERAGIAFVPFFPLGGGTTPLDGDRLAKLAAGHDATTTQIALAGLLALSPVMLAIPGTGSIEHLEENMAAGKVTLTAAELAG